MGPNQPGGPDSSSSLPNVPQGQGQIVGVQNQGVDVNGPGQGSNHGNYQVPGGHLVPMYQQPQIQNGQGGTSLLHQLCIFVYLNIIFSGPCIFRYRLLSPSLSRPLSLSLFLPFSLSPSLTPLIISSFLSLSLSLSLSVPNSSPYSPSSRSF